MINAPTPTWLEHDLDQPVDPWVTPQDEPDIDDDPLEYEQLYARGGR
jgi:hypothetical protein